MVRVSVYIDGFNLYFGMVDAGHPNLKWLDVVKLANSLLKPGQSLASVKYFTSMVTGEPSKEARQRTYIDAITQKGAIIIKGKYESKPVICNNCSSTWTRTNEKMTDVNIASNIIIDAINEEFDVAILISGDSDLVPAIKFVNDNRKHQSVTVIFPPGRSNLSVVAASNGSMTLGRKKLVDAQLENPVLRSDGFQLFKPLTW